MGDEIDESVGSWEPSKLNGFLGWRGVLDPRVAELCTARSGSGGARFMFRLRPPRQS